MSLCSMHAQDTVRRLEPLPTSLSCAAFIVGYGAHHVPSWQEVNHNVQEWSNEVSDGRSVKVDNYLQYAPLAALYGLKVCGVPSRDDYWPMTRLSVETFVVSTAVVHIVKNVTDVKRPDSWALNSFVSGHTATAFSNAELLRLEYRDVSPWIGVAGYTVAVVTGLLRIYNNRHWSADVVAGAGVGVLSAQVTNWVDGIVWKQRPSPIEMPQTAYILTLDD